MSVTGNRIHVTGIVQGVGFRPFIFNQAKKYSLLGWVRNTSSGVDIHIEGQLLAIESFLLTLKQTPPPLSKIDSISVQQVTPEGYLDFKIIHSEPIPNAFQPISPDVCICDDCLAEMFDPGNRRFRYPFINCTNCGPRFTIIKDIPYDRPYTTMDGFKMCKDCENEYKDPHDRRFHAQPIACPVCGPRIWLESSNGNIYDAEQALIQARELLMQGKILAIKGLGGFHLACDAKNASAVNELRRRKLRVDKPFAIMLPDIESAEKYCIVDDASRGLLASIQRPIVILPRRPGTPIALEITPGQNTIGVMLPYTPLHYLLFANDVTTPPLLAFDDLCLVMTSGNLREEPIAIDNLEALERLNGLADAFLLHDRPIHVRCDDSVVKTTPGGETLPIRRSRSYTPFPVYIPFSTPPILAVGCELKNTFCLSRDNYAFLSHHIGDMENYETLQSFENGISHFEKIFRVNPTLLACDLHPDYQATRYAENRSQNENIPIIKIQHHHAHVASCMAENNLRGDESVIGIAFDGTGYGLDGEIWGGEFLLADYHNFSRVYHLKYFPLPGGDRAIRKPARIALAYLWQLDEAWDENLSCVQALCADERTLLRAQLEHKINTPMTSSMGRLFDAVASLANVKHQVNYEAQAAIELEALVDPNETAIYPFELTNDGEGLNKSIDPSPMIRCILQDVLSQVAASVIAARFHNTVSEIVLQTARAIRFETSLNAVVLSGGVWQNVTLLVMAINKLKNDGFIVYTHHQVPSNDGGLALGQAVSAAKISENI